MPSAVQDQDQDQSMMDAAPQDQEQQYQAEDDELLEMEEKRIVLVRQSRFMMDWKGRMAEWQMLTYY